MKTRKCNILSAGEHEHPVLKIEEKEGNRITITHYRVEGIPSQFGGRAFRLFKDVEAEEEPTVYSVLVHGEHSLCDCPGQEYLRAKNAQDEEGRPRHCKHVASLSILLIRGKLK